MIVLGYAVKTLESKETKASNEITITHNSVFAAHRLQCRMPTRKIDIRHFVFTDCALHECRSRVRSAPFATLSTCDKHRLVHSGHPSTATSFQSAQQPEKAWPHRLGLKASMLSAGRSSDDLEYDRATAANASSN